MCERENVSSFILLFIAILALEEMPAFVLHLGFRPTELSYVSLITYLIDNSPDGVGIHSRARCCFLLVTDLKCRVVRGDVTVRTPPVRRNARE